MAPNRRKGSDGTKGDVAHQARESKHNPEHPAPSGNPDNQVDALDLTHDPERGADMAVVTENIRLSRDRRVNLVIFNHRMFSSYAHGNYPAWTWRPYSGDDPHTGHAHIEVNDEHHDQTQPWRIGMNPADEKALIYRVNALIDMTDNPFGDGLNPEKNRLAAAVNAITAALGAVATEVAKLAPVVAQMARDLEVMRARLDQLEADPAYRYTGTATMVLNIANVETAELRDIDRGGQ
jgi:hypothetical protein